MLQRLAIGIDIGGTKVKAGVVDEDGVVLERVMRDTPSTSPREVEDTIAEIVTELRQRHYVVALGIGAAGFVDSTRSTVVFSPHLAWRNEPLRDAIRRRVGLSAIVDNDANCAAWGEWRFGAAQNESDLVCITLGTGIGGGLVINGQVQRGRNGMSGEFGHMQMVKGGYDCECGNSGCWEQYASANALVRQARLLVESGSPDSAALLAHAGGDVDRLTAQLVTEVALTGDAAAIRLLADMGEWLGVGIANLAAALDPGTVVIGGGVSDAGDLLIGPATEAFRKALTGRGFRPEPRIVRAHLGNTAGMVGAADLARSASRRGSRRSRSRSRSSSRRTARAEARPTTLRSRRSHDHD